MNKISMGSFGIVLVLSVLGCSGLAHAQTPQDSQQTAAPPASVTPAPQTGTPSSVSITVQSPGSAQAPAPAAQQPGTVYQVVERPRRPHREPYEEGMPVPPGAYIGERSRTGLTVSGAVMFGVSYLASVFTWSVDYAVQDGNSDTGGLVIPLVGPLVVIPSVDKDLVPLLVLDTLVQTAGLTMFVLGLVLKSKYIVYAANDQKKPSYAFTPLIGPSASGLSFSARW